MYSFRVKMMVVYGFKLDNLLFNSSWLAVCVFSLRFRYYENNRIEY